MSTVRDVDITRNAQDVDEVSRLLRPFDDHSDTGRAAKAACGR